MSDPLVSALVRARRTGESLVEVPPAFDLATGYAIAARVEPLTGEPVGWKVGATSDGAQRFLGVDEPIRGRIYAHGLWHSPANLAAPGERACEVEPEIVLEVAPDGSATRAFLGIEVNRPSRDDALTLGAGFIVADSAAHVALVLGPEIPVGALDDPVAIAVTLEVDGKAVGEGTAAAVLGDPRRALAWLATRVTLTPGELVATGAMCRAAALPRGARAMARFAGLGEVAVTWPEVMGEPRE